MGILTAACDMDRCAFENGISFSLPRLLSADGRAIQAFSLCNVCPVCYHYSWGTADVHGAVSLPFIPCFASVIITILRL